MATEDVPRKYRAQFSPIEREEIAELKKIVKGQEKQIALMSKSLEMKEVLENVHTPKPQRIRYKKTKKPKAFQLHLSDTHSREIVTLKQTDGVNQHDATIGQERLRSIMVKAIHEMKREAADCTPVHLTVWGGGDYMVNADLHYKMERCVDVEPLIEMEHIYELLHRELNFLFSETPTDSNSFVGTFSNHGRDSEKMVLGFESARSYDSAIYRRLAKDFGDVRFDIADVPYSVEQIGEFRTIYTHGHAAGCSVRRNGQGLMIPKWSHIEEMRKRYVFHAWVQGHYHTKCALWSQWFAHIQNGCLVGSNSYSVSCGFPSEPPSQNLVVVDLENNLVEKVIALYA